LGLGLGPTPTPTPTPTPKKYSFIKLNYVPKNKLKYT